MILTSCFIGESKIATDAKNTKCKRIVLLWIWLICVEKCHVIIWNDDDDDGFIIRKQTKCCISPFMNRIEKTFAHTDKH